MELHAAKIDRVRWSAISWTSPHSSRLHFICICDKVRKFCFSISLHLPISILIPTTLRPQFTTLKKKSCRTVEFSIKYVVIHVSIENLFQRTPHTVDSVTKTELMFLHYMTSVSKGLHVEKILGRNLKFLSWFPSKTTLFAKEYIFWW